MNDIVSRPSAFILFSSVLYHIPFKVVQRKMLNVYTNVRTNHLNIYFVSGRDMRNITIMYFCDLKIEVY